MNKEKYVCCWSISSRQTIGIIQVRLLLKEIVGKSKTSYISLFICSQLTVTPLFIVLHTTFISFIRIIYVQIICFFLRSKCDQDTCASLESCLIDPRGNTCTDTFGSAVAPYGLVSALPSLQTWVDTIKDGIF